MTPTLKRRTIEVNGIRMHVAEAGEAAPVVGSASSFAGGKGETMKPINFRGSEGIHTGLVRDGGVEDLVASGLWQGPAPVALSDISALAAEIGAPASPLVPMESLRFAPVVMAPEKIICVGLNYRRHASRPTCQFPQRW